MYAEFFGWSVLRKVWESVLWRVDEIFSMVKGLKNAMKLCKFFEKMQNLLENLHISLQIGESLWLISRGAPVNGPDNIFFK